MWRLKLNFNLLNKEMKMPRNKILGGIRRGQVLRNHGPGSIIDFKLEKAGAVCVIAASIDQWPRARTSPSYNVKIEEERQFEDAKGKLKEAENESQKGSITDELEKLVEMKEKGLLTDQQFEDAKDKLLA